MRSHRRAVGGALDRHPGTGGVTGCQKSATSATAAAAKLEGEDEEAEKEGEEAAEEDEEVRRLASARVCTAAAAAALEIEIDSPAGARIPRCLAPHPNHAHALSAAGPPRRPRDAAIGREGKCIATRGGELSFAIAARKVKLYIKVGTVKTFFTNQVCFPHQCWKY